MNPRSSPFSTLTCAALISSYTRRPLGVNPRRALRVPEEVGIVAVLPDENEVRRRHVERDERATFGRARERVGGDTEPPGVVGLVVVRPDVLFLEEVDVLERQLEATRFLAGHASTLDKAKAPGQAIGGLRLVKAPGQAVGGLRLVNAPGQAVGGLLLVDG